MKWSGMFKPFNTGKGDVITQRGVHAEGDVLGKREMVPSTPLDAQERIDDLNAEIDSLRKKVESEHNAGYGDALIKVIKAVEATGPRTGRKQILAMLNEQYKARMEADNV